MLDTHARRPFAPTLESAAAKLSQAGLKAGTVTALGFVTGLGACFCTGLGEYLLAIALFLLHRFLSATAAVPNGKTILGTVSDFTIFGAFVFFFLMGALEHGLAATLVVFSFMVMGMAYCAYLVTAAKNGRDVETEGGVIGQTEMLIFIIVSCIYPAGFSAFAAVFALLCLATAILRTIKTVKGA